MNPSDYRERGKMTNEEHRKIRIAAAREAARTGYKKDLEYYMKLRNERYDLVKVADLERWEICNGRHTRSTQRDRLAQQAG